VTRSPEATETAAERLARHLRRGDLLLLEGPLGAGKTTFVRGLARGLGTQAHVMSPTFQLVRVYAGPLQLAHVDLYRLEQGAGVADLGLEELLDEGAVVVEWGDRLPSLAGARVTLQPVDESTRRLRLTGGGPAWTW
jgi:tRNA threonylcarbamoyladenosine biosynthesis protein TsaE